MATTGQASAQKITPCLWFDNNGEEAVSFYSSIFKDAKTLSTSYYGESVPGPKGSVLAIVFQLAGQEFMALNGGPTFKFTEAISLSVKCETQEEIDYYWEKLSEGGEESQCGWLKDKFGLSWQVVPSMVNDWISGEDQAKSDRVMKALMPMKKLDLATLKAAAEG